MDKKYKDAGKQSPGNNIADEQSSISKTPNEVGSFRKITLLLLCISNLWMEGAVGREEASWLHRSISIVSKVGR